MLSAKSIIQARPFRLAAVAALIGLIWCSTAVSAAARDRKSPTTPGNLRVTGTTAYSASLAWSPSTDDSGVFSYVIVASNGYSQTAPQTATSATFSAGLVSRQTYSFYIVAVDAAGNRSKNSNTVSATLPTDTTPPAKPVISATEVGPTHVRLAWSSTDEDPLIGYQLFFNGSPVWWAGRDTTYTFYGLAPETTYSFSVQARDHAGLWSPISDPAVVTTSPSDPNDDAPPTMPAGLTGFAVDTREVWLSWGAATDNVSPQEFLRYEVYVNGVLDDQAVGGRTTSIVYGEADMVNTFAVIAVDEAGNRSDPATVTVDLRF